MITYLLFTILGVILIILFILIFKLGKESNFLNSQKTVAEGISKLYERVGGLDRESREILQLTKSFHDILKPTKARGILGESILENLLRDILPKEVIIPQYGFKDGTRVDFVIKLPTVIVPIDAKFSVESFRNYIDAEEPDKKTQYRLCLDSIKKRISETAAYVYPDEGTSDFALMYVPSEGVYYFIITETQLLEFAHQKKVFIVGPNTLYAYLKTILIGFKAIKIEKKARQIYDNLKGLEKDVVNFMRDYGTLGIHIRSANSKYEDLAKRIENISFKLHTIEAEGDENSGKGTSQSFKG